MMAFLRNGGCLLAAALLVPACRTPIKTVDTGCQPLEEIPYDGVDQDCDGQDLTDVDGDGFDAPEAGGEDCDDSDATVFPGATEDWYDGVDQDCDGASDFDQDHDGFDSDGHDGSDCDDADASVNPDADEVWYDGVDQDCDGASDFDQDQDGQDSADYGGPDCDDDDATVFPGAAETPYDGIDQDCDGADLTDVDGDGYDAIEVGGDDCDDQDAAVFPGAAELLGDGADQDCDGLVDEYLVCADGSGQYTLIQDAIDDVADGSVIEICPGTYSERLSLISRTLEITGGGELPEDVLLTPPTGGAGVTVSGGDLSLSNFSIAAATGCNAIYTSTGAALSVFLVDFSGDGGPGSVEAHYSAGHTEIVSSRFYSSQVRIQGSGTVLGNTFEATSIYNSSSAGLGYVGGPWVYTNNIFFGGGMHITHNTLGDLRIENNTFADLSVFSIHNTLGNSASSGMPDVVVRDNIFSRLDFDSASRAAALWAVTWAYPDSVAAAEPEEWATNIVWDVEQDFGVLCSFDEDIWDYTCDFSYLSDVVSLGTIVVDPLFSPNATQGSYALDPFSPAIDAGSGARDVDGSQNDIGAFGGPDGDWYLEVPWLP
jgi:hypothetical protein